MEQIFDECESTVPGCAGTLNNTSHTVLVNITANAIRHQNVCELYYLMGSISIFYHELYADKGHFIHLTVQEYLADEQIAFMKQQTEHEKLLIQNHPTTLAPFVCGKS